MKKLAAALFLFAIFAWAADFWRSKPFTDWNDKEVRRILQDSPWAHMVNVSSSASDFPDSAGRQRPSPGVPGDPTGGASSTGGIDDPAARGIQGGRAGGGIDEMGRNAPSNLAVVVRWQSSLAVKQALVRFKYGNETGTSPEAKKMAEAADSNYVIVVTGIPKTTLRGDPDSIRKFLIAQTSMYVKGRETMKPVDVMTRSDDPVEVYFAFRKNPPLTVDDKDVDFATNLGGVMLRQRFHLKDMLLNGKLEL